MGKTGRTNKKYSAGHHELIKDNLESREIMTKKVNGKDSTVEFVTILS